ncbi:MAG TPA: FadR/GntR family transcriptional regulator [Symbiobacteriaceae bacterium]|jgi:GntR family transcriptional repressor for pyruvate dehydrogenase complex
MGRFARIENQRIYQQIVEQITVMVKDGNLKPGDRLPAERSLAEEFGVSRAAVREALSALGMMGLLEVHQGEGTFIRNIGTEALVPPMALAFAMEAEEAAGWELLEVRAALESEGAYLAAQRREPDDIAAMEAAVWDMQNLQGESLKAEADWRFHNAVASASGNSLIIQIMRTLTERMRVSLKDYRARLLRIPGNSVTLNSEHQAILDAIREGRAEDAHHAMRAHIERVKRTLYDDAPVS